MPPADRHDTDELVVRAALGEPLSEDERALIEDDDHLRAEVASFREVVDLARAAPEEVADSSTLDHLWAGIAAEAFGDRAATPDPAPPVAPAQDTDAADDNVVALRPRTPLWAGLAVAAAAAAVVALVAVGPWSSGGAPQPVAAADLQPFGDAEVDPVDAQFVAAGDVRELRLDLSGLPSPDGAFYEVWLLDLDEGRLVSLGPVRPDGTYVLPEGASPDDWPAVDVSVEPHDGDPDHSGASVLRGPVRPTA